MSETKKTLIYEAALSLVYENHELSGIKVADIAERANIGKGTVYEYFDSKEQVIGEALIYLFKRGMQQQFESLDEDMGFKDAYILFLSNLSTMMSNRNMFNLLTMNHKNLNVHVTIKAILHEQLKELRQRYLQLFEGLVDKSVQEGIIKVKPSRFDWEIAVLSSMTCIFVHKQYEEDLPSDEEILEKAYSLYVKLLS